MAWEEDRHERTEKATPKRREEARKKGQVARSREVLSTAILFAGVVIFYFSGQMMVRSMKEVMALFISGSGTFELTQESARTLLEESLRIFARILAPFLILPLVAAFVSVAQVGFLFTSETMKPNPQRLNPVEGLKRLISPTSLSELVKGIVKLLFIGYVSYGAVKEEVYGLGALTGADTMTILFYLGSSSFRVFLKTAWVLVVIAALDYAYQKWEMERNLRMTKQEVKEEFKEAEGDPRVKSRIRTLQRDLARKRMLADVPKATVVVTNPVHLAVALRYEHGETGAPVVVAKGAGIIAERIKEIAKDNSVPVVENRPLARLLYREAEVGKEIPVSLYRAVAELLAYVYSLRSGV